MRSGSDILACFPLFPFRPLLEHPQKPLKQDATLNAGASK